MNRLIHSNIAISALNSAKLNKTQLLGLDEQLSVIQTKKFVLQARKDNVNLIMLEQIERSIINCRKSIINTIASDVNTAIINAINALKISVQQGNYTMVILDDYMLQNIANFINEYYRSDEIKSAVKNTINATIVKFDIEHLLLKQPQIGLISLNRALQS